MPVLPIGSFDPATSDPYAGITPSTAGITPQHVPSGIPGEPDTSGTATIGTRSMPFPVQQDTPNEAASWIARFNEFDRIKRQAEEDRAWNEMYQQNGRVQVAAKAVESARRFQSVRNYQNRYNELVASGRTTQEAGFQATIENPYAFGPQFASSINAMRPERKPNAYNIPGVGMVVQSGRFGDRVQSAELLKPWSPTEGTTEGGTKYFRSGRGSAQLLKETVKLTPSQLMSRSKQLTEDLPMGKTPSPIVQEELDEINRQLRELSMKSKTASAPTGVQSTEKVILVRRKKDDKIFPYHGNSSDVPLDQYEILP